MDKKIFHSKIFYIYKKNSSNHLNISRMNPANYYNFFYLLIINEFILQYYC